MASAVRPFGTLSQIRGLLLDRGIAFPKSITRARRMIPEILTDEENELTALAREAIGELHDLFRDLDRRIASFDKKIERVFLVEIEVKAHKRVIRRPRWRRSCDCASSPMEVSVPPAPRLFPRTLYGTSFWALPVRALCLLPPRAPHRRVDGRSRPVGLARDAGRQPEAPRAVARGLGRALQHNARAHRDFSETPRYTGAVYRASGWIRVGTTQGRGRYDRQKQFDKPKKDVWLRPLRRDWKRTLNR